MKKLIRLSKSNIEYLDYVWNFTSGCKNGCSYCYARVIIGRFPAHYPNGFEPTIYPETLLSPIYLKGSSRIGVCFMGDLFGDGLRPSIMVASANSPYGKDLKTKVYDTIKACPQHTFIFLTKQPQNLSAWSPFPDNCWVGVSVCNDKMLDVAVDKLEDIQATVKYFSFEPLLDQLTLSLDYALYYSGISRVIIGAQTKPTVMPEKPWVDEIIEACRKASIPYFLKNNLRSLMGDDLVQEMPKGAEVGH